jgi:hypothetical protein
MPVDATSLLGLLVISFQAGLRGDNAAGLYRSDLRGRILFMH